MRTFIHRTLLLVVATGALGTGACSSDPVPNAVVRALTGNATVTAEADGLTRPATVEQGLFTGDLAQTGADGRMKLEFSNGDIIELDGNTTVEIRETGATETTVGAVVIKGVARAQAATNDLVLQIGLPFQNKVLEVGTGPVTIKVTEDQLAVLVGDAVVISDDGSRETVDEGRVLTVEGVVIDLADTPNEDNEELDRVVLEPIVITLFANPNQVQVKRKDRNDWVRPKKQDQLEAGDA
ncbi:MAG: hypothetical protein AAFX94_01025, partial [Myxococcota bacterium]